MRLYKIDENGTMRNVVELPPIVIGQQAVIGSHLGIVVDYGSDGVKIRTSEGFYKTAPLDKVILIRVGG